MAKKPMKKPTKKTAPKKASKPMKKAMKKAAKPAMKASPSVTPGGVTKTRTPSKPKNTRTLSYTQSEFVENIRAFCGLEKRSQAKQLCEDISLFLTDSLRRGYRIPLLGLGKLYVRESQARTGRNPATGEIIQIPKRKRVRFAVAKALKDQVLR
jgi:nucleoid DNA-binding protein